MKILSIAAIIAIITITMFAAAGGYGLINLDDYLYVLEHPEVTGGLSLVGVKWAFSWLGNAMWTPLTWLSYMADYSIGWGVSGMHWFAIALHGINAVLLFILITLLFGKERWTVLTAALAALCWAIHPLRVESVVWVASRKDVLSTFFFLFALICWAKGTRIALVATILLMLLGGMAKASVMILPAFALGIDLVQFVKCEFRSASSAFSTFCTQLRTPHSALRAKLAAYAAIIALSLAYAVESGWAQHVGGAMSVVEVPRWYALVNAASTLTVYIGNTLCPNNLALQCLIRYPSFPRWSLLGLVVFLGFCWWGYNLARRIWEARSIAGFHQEVVCLAWVLIFFLGLIPFLGLVPFGIHAFADRFTILPSIALSFAIVSFTAFFLHTPHKAPDAKHPILLLSVLCIALGALTVRQIGFWKDDATLFGRTIEVDGPANLPAQIYVGLYHWEIEHDMERSYQYLSSLMTATPWLADRYGQYAPFLIEAAYATGRKEEASDACAWLNQWDRRQVQRARHEGNFVLETTITAMFGEAIRLVNTEGQLENAKSKLAQLKKLSPRHVLTLEIAWQIANREGDATAIAKAREECLLAEGDPYCKNRWAAKVKNR